MTESEKYYILGFIYADGCLNKNGTIAVSQSIKNMDIVEKITKCLSVKVYKRTNKLNGKTYPRIDILYQ